MKILITELIWEEGIKELTDQGFEIEYDETLWSKREQLLEIIPRFDAVIVRNQTKVDHDLLNSGINLKAVGRLGVGLDNIDLKIAKEKNIKVVYAKHANATSVAEYVITAMLNVQRPLHLAELDVREGNWNRKKYTCGELYQKTIGLVGLGEISHRVSKRAKAFGMNVIGYDPFVTEYDNILAETGVEIKSLLNDVLSKSDFVSLHVPLTPQTYSLIGQNELKLMKPTSYIINTARGGIIDETALAEALNHNMISGAFLDVLVVEPLDLGHPLLECNNAFITPHIAGLTNESQIRTSSLVAKEIIKVLSGKVSLCIV
ncbi:hydroxyacid dehydrogenase [Peribacillus frigoritolerans]